MGYKMGNSWVQNLLRPPPPPQSTTDKTHAPPLKVWNLFVPPPSPLVPPLQNSYNFVTPPCHARLKLVSPPPSLILLPGLVPTPTVL